MNEGFRSIHSTLNTQHATFNISVFRWSGIFSRDGIEKGLYT
jgi:hypothetical protein